MNATSNNLTIKIAGLSSLIGALMAIPISLFMSINDSFNEENELEVELGIPLYN